MDAESRVRFLLQRLDELQTRLHGTVGRVFEPIVNELSQFQKEIRSQIRYYLSARKQSLDAVTQQLSAYSPLQVLERGYAIVSTKKGQIVRAPEQIDIGERFGIRVAGGEFRARKERNNGV